jgi:hypothetical protein
MATRRGDTIVPLPPAVRELHTLGITGKGVTVGHLDTGIDINNTKIPPSAVREFRVFDDLGRSIVTRPEDAEGHGSVTASVLHQVAPEADILSAVVFDGGHVYARILAAMSWLLKQSADIVLMSFGVPCRTSLFERMLQALTQNNALCVVASGNNGTGTMFSPAWSSHALTVGAFDEPSGLPAVYSSCIEVDGGARRKPEVLAPGSVGDASGTSIASAFVAGLACLLRQASPGATPEALKQAFAASCSPLSEMAYKAEHGLVDAQKIADLCVGKLGAARPTPISHACSRWVLPRNEGLRDGMAGRLEEGRHKVLLFLREGAEAVAFQRRVMEQWPVIWLIAEQGIVFCEATAQGIEELRQDENVEAIYSAKP